MADQEMWTQKSVYLVKIFSSVKGQWEPFRGSLGFCFFVPVLGSEASDYCFFQYLRNLRLRKAMSPAQGHTSVR